MYFCRLSKQHALGVGVMATLQILVLSLKVRVLHAQPKRPAVTQVFYFFNYFDCGVTQ